MTVGPGSKRAAAPEGRGHLRASHADREQVVDVLKAAFVQGRLTKDEFDERMGQAFVSRTYAELAALTADIPAPLTPGQPPAPRAQSTPRQVALARAGTLVAPAAMVAAFVMKNEALFVVFFLPTIISFMAWLVAGAALLDSRSRTRSGGAPPAPLRIGRAPGPRDPRHADRGLFHSLAPEPGS